MFDIGWSEMLVLAVVVIVIVGPKELPGMLRTFGKTTAKLRVMANDFRKQFDEALKEAELDDVKKMADDVRALNPTNEIRKALSPMQKVAQDVRAGLDTAMNPTARPAPSPEIPAAGENPKPAEPVKQGATAQPGEANGAAPAVPAKAAAPKAAASKKPVAAKKPAAPKKPAARAGSAGAKNGKAAS